MNINDYNDFRRMCEILNKRFDYEEMVQNEHFSLPKKVKAHLNLDNANWIITKVMNLNAKHPRVNDLIQLCKDYISLTNLESNEVKAFL